MIPAATVPGVGLAPCTPAAPCWIAGTGFRAVVDNAEACAIDDAPLAGKVPPGSVLTALPVDPLAVLPAAVLGAASTPSPAIAGVLGLPPLIGGDGPCCIIREPAEPMPPLAPVPVMAGGATLLIAALALLALLRGRR